MPGMPVSTGVASTWLKHAVVPMPRGGWNSITCLCTANSREHFSMEPSILNKGANICDRTMEKGPCRANNDFSV